MEISTVITGIGGAITTLGKLREAAAKFKNAELKTLIAELADQLSDAKLNMAELKEEIVSLRLENASLKDNRKDEQPTIFWGCYIFDGNQERLYCTACYDTQGKKHLTTRVNSRRRQCPVCKAVTGT